jgi:hypothetical protein
MSTYFPIRVLDWIQVAPSETWTAGALSRFLKAINPSSPPTTCPLEKSSFRPVHRPTATGEEVSRQPLLRSKEFGRPSIELLSPYGGFRSLDGVGQQMLETTMMLWWLRKTHLALPGYWIFPEDFLEKCYGFWSNLSLDKDQKLGHPSVFDMALLYDA